MYSITTDYYTGRIFTKINFVEIFYSKEQMSKPYMLLKYIAKNKKIFSEKTSVPLYF